MPNPGATNLPSQPLQHPGTLPEGSGSSQPNSQMQHPQMPQMPQVPGQVPIQQQPLFAQPQPVISPEMLALSLNPQFQMIKAQVQQNPA